MCAGVWPKVRRLGSVVSVRRGLAEFARHFDSLTFLFRICDLCEPVWPSGKALG